MELTAQQKLDKLETIEKLLATAWVELYNLDPGLYSKIAETRFEVNEAQCRLIEATTILKQEINKI